MSSLSSTTHRRIALPKEAKGGQPLIPSFGRLPHGKGRDVVARAYVLLSEDS